MNNRVDSGSSFVPLIQSNRIPFKIPVLTASYVTDYSDVFEMGTAEYGTMIDTWLFHNVINEGSEMVVMGLDYLWQGVMSILCGLSVLLDQHDPSSMIRLRPDFTALFRNMLVMKGEAKADQNDMVSHALDLITKFHETAHLMFPSGCDSIPAVTTSNRAIDLYSISYNASTKDFKMTLIRSYDVSQLRGRVEFIRDLMNIMRWIVSQTTPMGHFHLTSGCRQKTLNEHHVTLRSDGIFKEFNLKRLHMNIIKFVLTLLIL
jgi:hypothetical protein